MGYAWRVMPRFRAIGLVFSILLAVAACSADDPSVPSGGDASIPGIDANAGGCTGCLDSLGECVDGLSDDDCGGNGDTCVTCTGDDTCAENQCVSPPTCNADNCSGCCLPDATCVEDGDQSASECGTGGFECTTCDSGICEAGACKEACSPTTCSGCCDGPTIDDCVEIGNAQSSLACGTGGMACSTCEATSTCTQGTCVETSCIADCPQGCCEETSCRDGDANDECGTGGEACFGCGTDQTCSNGVCVVDPDSLWNFVIISADVPTMDANGDSWDSFGGAPDVFIRTTLGVDSGAPVTADSVEVENQFLPQFNPPDGQVVLTNVPASKILDSIRFEVRDSDLVGSQLMLAMIDNMPSEAVFGGTLFFVLSVGEYTVRFKIVKP